MAAKVIQYGVNKPLSISLPVKYFDILSLMAQLEGKEIEELATERLRQIIIEDIIHDEEYWGKPLSRNWKDTSKMTYTLRMCVANGNCKRKRLFDNIIHAG